MQSNFLYINKQVFLKYQEPTMIISVCVLYNIFVSQYYYLLHFYQTVFSQKQMQTPSTTKKVKMKITVIGDQKSGKTSFIRNLVNQQFDPHYTQTQNFQITVYNITNNKTQYEIHFWECGARYFSNNKYLRKAFFKNSSATFLIFDICNSKWREKLPKWIEEAYNCQSFLIYAIGTKKELYETKSLDEKLKLLQNKMSQKSLFDESCIQEVTEGYEYEFNMFFEQYQIKHFYQSATEKIPYEIKNIFVTINDDKQKLTRSSLARGTKFDNSLVENYISKFRQRQVKKSTYQESIIPGSVKIEFIDDLNTKNTD